MSMIEPVIPTSERRNNLNIFRAKIGGRLKYGTGSTEHETRNEFREKID